MKSYQTVNFITKHLCSNPVFLGLYCKTRIPAFPVDLSFTSTMREILDAQKGAYTPGSDTITN